jgi:SagB-type dehydrogenase family enzyme
MHGADRLQALGPAAHEQAVVTSASLIFIFTAVLRPSRKKYGLRALRYATLEAGHIAQNLALTAGALGLASCSVSAFTDEELNAPLGVDAAQESAIYLFAVGHRVVHVQP